MSMGDLSFYLLISLSVVWLVKVIPKYFIYVETIVKGVVSLLSSSVCLSFLSKRATGFCELILYPAT